MLDTLKNLIFALRFGFRGYPVHIGKKPFRVDESLRRWSFNQEEEVRLCIEENACPGDLAVDIGANFGLHTLIMAEKVGATGSVIAFEPIPANLRLLRRNIQLNHFENKVTIVATALSDYDSKTLKMQFDSDSLEPSASITTGLHSSPREIEVRNQSLDDALQDVERHRKCFIKIDVEGAELSVLRSGTNVLQRIRPTLLVEVHDYALPSFGGSTEMLYEFLKAIGYSFQVITNMNNHNGLYHHILAKPDSDPKR